MTISPQGVDAYMCAAPAFDGLSREDAIVVLRSLSLLVPPPKQVPYEAAPFTSSDPTGKAAK